MSQLIHIDFKRRIQVSSRVPIEAPVRPDPKDMFGHYDYMIECIRARFGDDLPAHFPVYKQSLKTNIFDTYGHGCVHNSIHQKRTTLWNKPFPIPADLRAIDKYLSARSGKVLVLGDKSDPFMWMDQKYSVTKSVLELANKHHVSLEIRTMSDLCAMDTYFNLIKEGEGGHSIVMQMGFSDPVLAIDTIERAVSPGAPSLTRRQHAIDKLVSAGITVHTKTTDLASLTKAQRIEFSRATGSTVEYYLSEVRGAK